MKDLPQELIYVVLFGVVLLVQYLMKRFGLSRQPRFPHDEPVQESPEQEETTPEPSLLSTAADFRFGRSEAPHSSPPLSRPRFSRRALMGSKREVQNAIVIATILGPCRAFEAHDVR